MELLREEFRPRRAPFRGQGGEISRADLVAFGVRRRRGPGLCALHINVRDRHQPARVVERSGPQVDDVLAPRAVAMDAAAAIAAKP